MFEAVRIVIIAYTASFRVPFFVARQLTLPVPPLSTVYGLISAAVGKFVKPEEVEWLAYMCEYEGKAEDVEKIYTLDRPKSSNRIFFDKVSVIKREFLAMPKLTLYLPPKWEGFFLRPRYQLLLGTIQDLAAVESTNHVVLRSVEEENVEVRGVLLPMEVVNKSKVSVIFYNLPIAFTEDPRREPRGVEIFGIVDFHAPKKVRAVKGWFVKDEEKNVVLPTFKREWVLSVVRK